MILKGPSPKYGLGFPAAVAIDVTCTAAFAVGFAVGFAVAVAVAVGFAVGLLLLLPT